MKTLFYLQIVEKNEAILILGRLSMKKKEVALDGKMTRWLFHSYCAINPVFSCYI